jgi:hypothetical protein
MEVTAIVDDDIIFKRTIEFLYYKLPFTSIEIIGREIFNSGDLYLKDLMGLAIAHIEDRRFIPLMNEVIKNESHKELKKDLQQVLNNLIGMSGL